MSSLAFLPVSRGTLVKLRERYEVARRGKEVLEMRREQLIKEVFFLMDKLKERDVLEKELLEALDRVSRLRMYKGEGEFRSLSALVKPPKIEVLLTSIQGVPVPQARILEEPDLSEVTDVEFIAAYESLWKVFKPLIELANIEIAVEKLSKQLSYINRVVNSLERNLLPQLKDMISYIEERLDEEMISEFVRLKKISGES
ncbi:MAG: hypothetical protein DRJ41_00215 [Thermoprotei archaeon]|nr:MAG: hypothetical protein DRJ41_00215 [Thermoprotei archaeon]